jgi:hypothetical protein
VTFLPVMVTAMDLPAGRSLAGGGVVGLFADGGVVLPVPEPAEALAEVVGLPLAAGDPEPPPQAVTASASAAAAAYQAPLEGVIFVTRCSLDSAI